MKILATIALLGLSVNAFSLQGVADFSVGLLQGALQEEGFGDIVSCFSDAETIGEDIYEAVKDFENKTYEGTMSGVEEMGIAVEMISTAMGSCEYIKQDISKMKIMAGLFKSPYSLAFNVGKDLIVNGVQIFHEIEDAVTACKASNMTGCGYYIGTALTNVLMGNPINLLITKQDNQAYEVLGGFASEIDKDKSDAQTLYNNILGLGEKLMPVINATFHHGALHPMQESNAQQLVRELGAALELAFNTLDSVHAMPHSMAAIKQAVQCMKTITSTELTFGAKWDLSDAITSYDTGNYVAFGQEIGEIAVNHCLKKSLIE